VSTRRCLRCAVLLSKPFYPWLATSCRSVTTPKVNYCAAIICPASQSHHEWLNDPKMLHFQPAKIWHRTQTRALRMSMVIRRVQRQSGIDTPDSLNHAQGVSLPFCERVISWPKDSMPPLWHVTPDLHLGKPNRIKVETCSRNFCTAVVKLSRVSMGCALVTRPAESTEFVMVNAEKVRVGHD